MQPVLIRMHPADNACHRGQRWQLGIRFYGTGRACPAGACFAGVQGALVDTPRGGAVRRYRVTIGTAVEDMTAYRHQPSMK